MREFELVIDGLKNGLSPLRKTPANTQILFECLGFRCGIGELEPYEELENPLPATIDLLYSWPFPQFLTGERYNFLLIRDDVTNMEDILYQVSDDHQTLTHIISIDQLTFGTGSLMELADFGEYAFLTNGVVMVYRDTTLNNWQKASSLTKIPMMKTVCNFKGQMIGGNIVSAWHSCNEQYYVWSKIGEADFTPDRKNQSGFRRDPYGGEVFHVRRLGDSVIGYSSKGIISMVPVGSPAATFAFIELLDIGLVNRGAINGNQFIQCFVGEDYILRRITSNGIEELGYQNQMESLIGEDIIVNFDPSLKDFYIGNSSKTFLLTSKGLTEVPQHPSNVWRKNSQTYMLPDAIDDYQALIVTEQFNMEYSGQKTISTIESDLIADNNGEIAVDYSLDNKVFATTPFNPINDQGSGFISAVGNSLRFRLRFNPDLGATIGYIKVRYKMTDLRGIRGVYAPPLRGQR